MQIQQHLAHIHAWVGELEGLAPEAQRERMRQVVAFLEDHIVSHAQWEERALYPAVDSRALSGDHPFTASMRYEHGIVGRWIAEMERFAAAEPPDVRAFSRRADNLLGLIWAHFEEEEEVLLPILDQSMTPEEFQREILEGAEHPSG